MSVPDTENTLREALREIARLRERWDNAQTSDAFDITEAFWDAVALADAALASVRAVPDTTRHTEALRTYGYHLVTCHLWPKQNTGRCTCGFDNALALAVLVSGEGTP